MSVALTTRVQQDCGIGAVLGEVDATHRLFREPRAEHLVVGLTDPQPEEQPVGATCIEAFRAGEQQLADPIQRVVLATPMLERLLLHPTADPIDTAVRDPHRGMGPRPESRDPSAATGRPGSSRPDRWRRH